MSRIPNPFTGGQGHQQNTPQKPQTPGFLLMTRPPTGSNSYGGGNGGGGGFKGQYSPASSPSRPADSFIPFSSTGVGLNRHGGNRGGGGGGGKFNRGGGRHMTNQGPQRFAYPYQQNPGWMPSPYGQGNQGYMNSPRGRQSHGNQRGGRFGGDNRFGSSGGRKMHGKGPLSDVPIDKFVSKSMVKDPWAELDKDEVVAADSSSVISLDNSEIIIDSDTSVVIENSYEEGVSGTEGDSSPVHDTGSDSPYVATSSTSEKDTGSDTASDA